VKIYTKTGDQGTTGLALGGRVEKNHPIIHLVGDLDELNSFIGRALTKDVDSGTRDLLLKVQSCLFDAGAEVSSQGGIPGNYRDITAALEGDIDAKTLKLPPLKHFILPGGSPEAADLHVARSVCRRVERAALTLLGHAEGPNEMFILLNRLSDWLFCAARWENARQGVADTPWIKS
jgi:cob(I)alamin adenosyltransferase